MAKNQHKNHSKPAAHEAPAPIVQPAAEESKGLFARAAEAIDHVIHPDSAPKSEPDLVESSEVIPQAHVERAKSVEGVSKAEADYEQHPKFSKFKKGVN